jgi:hypothetical protein
MSANATSATAWDDALRDAARLALAEGERAAGQTIAALPRPARLPSRARHARRLALLHAALAARSSACHWDLSRQVADLPGGPTFARSLAPWEARTLVDAWWRGPADGVYAAHWRDGVLPVGQWEAMWLHLIACLRPPRVRRERPSIRISAQTRTVLTDLAQQAAEQARARPGATCSRSQVDPATRDDRRP